MPDVSFEQVIAAALEVRDWLTEVGLRGLSKTTSGKGLHVTAPLKGDGGNWPQAKAVALRLFHGMEADTPRYYTKTMAKTARHGHIFLDYLRNDRLATAVAGYLPRARPGASVSMPLAWEEVVTGLDPAVYTLRTACKRGANPWADYEISARPLQKAR